MRFLTPKLREVDIKSAGKLHAQENDAQEAAQFCVHYYTLTNLSLGKNLDQRLMAQDNPTHKRWVKEEGTSRDSSLLIRK
jgi:hypothetical protein